MGNFYNQTDDAVHYQFTSNAIDFEARKKDDQTNNLLNGFIALIGIAGFFGTLLMLNNQYKPDETVYHSTGNLCAKAMANAGIFYNESPAPVRLAVSSSGNAGLPVSFTVTGAPNATYRIRFGDGAQMKLKERTCFHTYSTPGVYQVEVQQLMSGSWRTLSVEQLELSGIRESAILGYSRYN